MRPIVSIASPGNGSGKTSLAVTILRAHPGAFTAVKMTTVYRDGENCPRTEAACACRTLHGPYTVVSDPTVVAAPGTDTGKLHAAGARRTLWCLSIPSATTLAWTHLVSDLLEPGEAVLTEGNRIAAAADPDLLILVVNPETPRARWKGDTWDLAARSALVVVNIPAGAGDAASSAMARDLATEIGARCAAPRAFPARVVLQDVTVPLERWSDPEPARLLSALLARRGHGQRTAGG